MEFHQIRYFLAVCDRMNFTKAAEACHVSQPALTKAIQKLEGELGGALFLRERGRIALTDLGRVMRTHFARIEETRESARQAARALAGIETAQLNVGIMCTVGPRLISPALAAFQERHPGVELLLHDVWARKGHELLLSGALDCAIMGRHQPLPERFAAVPLYREPFILALPRSHPLATKNEIRLADLAGCAYADRLRCEFRELFMERLEARGFAVKLVMRSEREDWIQTAVARGHGLCMIPLYSITDDEVVARRVEDLSVDREVEALTVRDRVAPPALSELLAFLKRYTWPLESDPPR